MSRPLLGADSACIVAPRGDDARLAVMDLTDGDGMDGAPAAYAAMSQRRAIKSHIEVNAA